MTNDQASPLPSDAPSPNPGMPVPAQGQARTIDPFLIVGVLGIWLIALVMRLWQLDQFDAPVFDEVYFPEFAQNYLDDKSFYDVHPPLGKYLIAVAILLFGRNELGFRIMPALFGSLIPVLVAGVAYRLSYQRTFALLAGALMLTDGLFLVESRYGLMNVFLVVFGFAAQIFLLVGLERRGMHRAGFFMLSGLMLGAAVAVKWNGLWFAFMFGGLGLLIWILAAQARNLLLLGLGMLMAGGLGWFAEGEAAPTALQILQPFAHPLWFGMALVLLTLAAGVWRFPQHFRQHLAKMGILAEIAQLRWWHYLICYILPIFLIYFLQWIPHLIQNPQDGIVLKPGLSSIPDAWQSFVKINQSLWGGQNAGNLIVTDDTPVHPYCSSSLRALTTWFPHWVFLRTQRLWNAGAWSWPVLARPIGYYFADNDGQWSVVHAIGNPVLWWLSTGAILYLTASCTRRFDGVAAFILMGYASNYLPWFIVSRCVFLYHYMSALAFSIMALAWVLVQLLRSDRPPWQFLGMSMVAGVLLCQLLFLPIWFGFPLSSSQFYQRMWFRGSPVPLCLSEASCATTPVRIPAIPGFNWI